jgi:hypothetical protein
LNPINFNEEDLPAFKVEVSGSIDVSISDVAVFWLINRTRTVDVTEFTIERPRLASEPVEEPYGYPKVYDTGKPKAGTSLASYHLPTETYYTVSVTTTEPDSAGGPKVFEFEAQFPRPNDYRYYLYWTVSGELVLVDESKMTDLPADPNSNFPDPKPSSLDAQTFVVLNVTPDQNLDRVEFFKDPNAYEIAGEPKAKDQKLILLASGSYVTKAHYTRGGTSSTTTEKNISVTKEEAGMAVRTNFVYFYKTTSGDYQLSQTWPPIPNDASDANKLEDALLEGQGMLRIVNKAIPGQAHAIIARIKIDDAEFPNSTNTAPYMVFGDVKSFIFDAGIVHVAFKPTDQAVYGMDIPREIHSKQITTLEYTADLANADIIPPDDGYGAGLIRITNHSQGIVYGATIFDRNDLSKSMIYGYEDFSPPQIINYNQVGRLPVVGDADFPLLANAVQLIQVYLDTAEGPVSVERVASINGNIIDITISQEEVEKRNRIGSKVTVQNITASSTVITSLQVYNKDNPNVSVVYNLNVSNPASQDVYVLSGTGFPIVPDGRYEAELTVYGNGQSAIITKEFSPDGVLYSTAPDTHTRTITLTEADLPSDWRFIPITGITVTGTLAATTTYTVNIGSIVVPGALNLNGVSLSFVPSTASKQSPVNWEEVADPNNLVTITNNVLTVTGVPSTLTPNGTTSASVTVKATIPGGGTNGGDFTTGPFTVSLPYEDGSPPSNNPVGSIILSSPGSIEIGQVLSLPPLASFNPPDAHIGNTPITTADIVWSGTGVSGNTFTAASAGTFTVTATLPAAKNNGALVTETVTVTVNLPPAPTTLALRIILVNKLDSLKQIAVVPTDTAEPWALGQQSAHTGNGTISTTGYTAYPWATGLTYDPTYTTSNRFATRWPESYYGTFYRTVDLPKGEWNYKDVTIPWPTDNKKGYCLFFLEGDNRARGYCYPGNKTAPAKAENFLFYLRADALTPIWLDANNYERAPGTAGAVPVIPISYHTDNNVSSIMKSAGIGNRPTYKITF